MSVGTWTRFSAVPVRSLNRRPQSRQQKRRKPWTVRPSRSRVDDEWQCGQSMAALLIAQNGPGNLSVHTAPGKLPRDLTEPRIRGLEAGDVRPTGCIKGQLTVVRRPRTADPSYSGFRVAKRGRWLELSRRPVKLGGDHARLLTGSTRARFTSL